MPSQDLQIISTDESQVFVAVQEWYQTDTYNLYQSDPRGVHYVLVLEDVRSSRQAEDSVLVDILEVGCPLPPGPLLPTPSQAAHSCHTGFPGPGAGGSPALSPWRILSTPCLHRSGG